jgi:hypothetical protein
MQLRSFLTLIALCLCAGLFAQTTAERAGKRAKNRAEYKTQSKVDQKVDKAVDDTFSAIGGLFKKKNKNQPANGAETGSDAAKDAEYASNNGLGGEDDGEYEGFTNPYTFSMDMEVTETKSNGKSETNTMRMAVTSNRYAVLINDPDGKGSSRMIFNTEDGKTTMITTDKNGKKTGFRMKMPGTRKFTADVAEDLSDRFVFTRTGERKNVNGYDCEKIIVEDTKEGTTTESWVTQDLGMSSKDIFGGFMGAMGGRAKMGNGNMMEQPFEGFPIMSTTVDKGKTYVTNFKNIKIGEDKYDSSLMDTSGVEIQSLGF